MKFIHLSDLHLGKRVYEYSMLEDQEYILKKIINIVDEEKPEGVIIAGDIYDKSVPSAEAVSLFDDFLVALAKRKLEVFVISGNHDSPERIAFGSRIMDATGIHMSPVYDKTIDPITVRSKDIEANVYMLPFIKPVHVRKAFPNEKIESYTDAIDCVIKNMDIDDTKINILVAHQFVTGSSRSDSEDYIVGGLDNVDSYVFKPFDYVALGHLHNPQDCGSDNIRYCGSPLKYSFSEAKSEKSVTVIEFEGKGAFSKKIIPLKPKRDLVEIKGEYKDLTAKSFYENTSYRDDYVHITLTDENFIPDVVSKLRVIYRNLMKVDYDNETTRKNTVINTDSDVKRKTPHELFSDFYEMQNAQPMNKEQSDFMKELIKKIEEKTIQ